MPLVFFYTPWKHQGYRKRPVAWNGLNFKSIITYLVHEEFFIGFGTFCVLWTSFSIKKCIYFLLNYFIKIRKRQLLGKFVKFLSILPLRKSSIFYFLSIVTRENGRITLYLPLSISPALNQWYSIWPITAESPLLPFYLKSFVGFELRTLIFNYWTIHLYYRQQWKFKMRNDLSKLNRTKKLW